MQKSLVDSRYKYPVSDRELERRLCGVQAMMKEDGIDCLITQTQSPIFDRGIRYFIDDQTGTYTSALLIPAEGKMTLLIHGHNSDSAPVTHSLRNVEKLITKAYCQPFAFTDNLAGEVIANEIKAKGFQNIALFCRQCISMAFGEALKASLPSCTFTDYTVRVGKFMAVKSEEEWDLINKSLLIHGQLMDAVPALIRPGFMEYQIRSEIEKMALNLGCDVIGNVSVGSAPSGGMSMFVPHFKENRRIEEGDTVTVMIEVAGPGGMYCELARTFCLGKPNDSLLELYEIARGAQHAVAAAAKPGVTGAALTKVFDEYVTCHGLAANARFVGHGQGLDMMESPAICAEETMDLEEGMFLAIHPELARPNNNGVDFATCCDNYRVTKDGAVRLTTTAQQINELKF